MKRSRLGPGERIGARVVKHDRNDGGFQRRRAVDGQVNRPRRLGLNPVAQAPVRPVSGENDVNAGGQCVEGGVPAVSGLGYPARGQGENLVSALFPMIGTYNRSRAAEFPPCATLRLGRSGTAMRSTGLPCAAIGGAKQMLTSLGFPARAGSNPPEGRATRQERRPGSD
jgi:hypothetical protein